MSKKKKRAERERGTESLSTGLGHDESCGVSATLTLQSQDQRGADQVESSRHSDEQWGALGQARGEGVPAEDPKSVASRISQRREAGLIAGGHSSLRSRCMVWRRGTRGQCRNRDDAH